MAFKNEKRSSLVIYVDNNNIEKALSKLRQASAAILKEVKERRYYMKPSEKRRKRMKDAIKNARREQRLRDMYF